MKQIGIDLGTTNTVAAVDGHVVEVAKDRSALLPSVVAFPPSGATLVGVDARRRKTIDVKNTIFSAKRIIGRKWYSADTAEFKKRYTFDLVEKDDGPAFETRAGVFTPEEIAVKVLDRVAKHDLVAPIVGSFKTVVAVPSLFGHDEREATRKAAENAGFKKVEIIDEPSATAAAYLSRRAQKITYAAVYDFGGGTFDLAIVDCASTPYRVLAHEGDLYLGGDDVDFNLALWVVDEVLRTHGWDLKNEPSTFARLVVECERVKVAMGDSESCALDLMQVDPAAPASVSTIEIKRETLDALSENLVMRTFVLCDQVLKKAGLKAEQMDAVFVAGGGTLLSSVRKGVENFFQKRIEYPFNPMQIVAIGASLRA